MFQGLQTTNPLILMLCMCTHWADQDNPIITLVVSTQQMRYIQHIHQVPSYSQGTFERRTHNGPGTFNIFTRSLHTALGHLTEVHTQWTWYIQHIHQVPSYSPETFEKRTHNGPGTFNIFTRSLHTALGHLGDIHTMNLVHSTYSPGPFIQP
jgi:hypothetical protein